MITDKQQRLNRSLLFLIVISFLASHLCFSLLPGIFETFNAKAFDSLFLFRTKYPRPSYDDTIVHVDLNNTTIRDLNNYYLNRSHDARIIRNLSAMNVAAQLYDVVYAARKNETRDRELITATAEAGNVYLGMTFNELIKDTKTRQFNSVNEQDMKYLEKTK